MAIIVEEEKKNGNLIAVVGWILIFGIIAVAGYYVFIAAPETVIVTSPSELQQITPITQINFNPQAVVSSQGFQSLKQYIPEPTTSTFPIGRSNPFVTP